MSSAVEIMSIDCPLPCEDGRQGSLEPLRRALKAVSGKWKWEILCLLSSGPKRFTELRRSIPGVTQHMLAAQLKDLEHDGIVLRTAFDEMPPRVEYELSPAGRELRPIAEALQAWGAAHP
jgi:DNA-binding HxlR family transcriptional regulator